MKTRAVSTTPQRKALAIVLATALAVPAEGLRQFAYYDPPGILTACYGHTGPDVFKNIRYSMDQCKRWLSADMLEAVNTVERCVPGLPAVILAAFADAVFNLGPTIVCNRKASTAARYLYAGKLIEACKQLPRWDKARVLGVMVALPGLTKRRAAEMQLCLTGTAHEPASIRLQGDAQSVLPPAVLATAGDVVTRNRERRHLVWRQPDPAYRPA